MMLRWCATAMVTLLLAGCLGAEEAPAEPAGTPLAGADTPVAAAPTRAPSGATFGEGAFVVGQDIEPGRYRAVNASDECVWQRLHEFTEEIEGGPDDEHVAGQGGSFIPFVDIAPTDAGFVSMGCGTWSADLSPRISPGQTFGAGTYLVGPEVLPGRYRATDPTPECEWWRMSGFSGEYFDTGDVHVLADLIDGGYAREGAAIAEIASTDTAFFSHGCGEWGTDFTPRVTPGEAFGGGTLMVGAEIEPGRYRASTSDGACHWRRLSGFSGFSSSHLGYDRVERGAGPAIADIAATDVGFSSRGCGLWQVYERSGRPPKTSFDDGTYVVGPDVAPGRYRANSPSYCSWERLSGFGGSEEEVLAHVAGAIIVDIKATDAGFRTKNCGTWSMDLGQTARPRRSFGPGTFIVGSEITPGRYEATTARGCWWWRLSGFGGADEDVIESGSFVDEPAIVEIEASDAGFNSSGCGVWWPDTVMSQ